MVLKECHAEGRAAAGPFGKRTSAKSSHELSHVALGPAQPPQQGPFAAKHVQNNHRRAGHNHANSKGCVLS